MMRLLLAMAVAFPLLHSAYGQTSPAAYFAAQVATGVAGMTAQPTLEHWRASFSHEKLDRAPVPEAAAAYKVDFGRENRLCAVSIGQTRESTRAAMFYQPRAKAGALAPLPAAQDASLINQCVLQALWYRAPVGIQREDLVRQLSERWGNPNDALHQNEIQSGGLWEGNSWHRGAMDVWVANVPRSAELVVYARITVMHPFGFVYPPLDVRAQAAAIAALSPALTTGILSPAVAGEPQLFPLRVVPRKRNAPAQRLCRGDELAPPLERWLSAARDLPSDRKAAALLLADLYVQRTLCESEDVIKQYRRLGANVSAGHYGPEYTRNLLEAAYRLTPKSPAGELVRLVRWGPEEETGKLLDDFTPDQWTPYVYYKLAAGHDLNLSVALFREGKFCKPEAMTPQSRRREREEAIRYFRKYVAASPERPEAAFAWEECWRLLAVLPPTRFNDACSESD